MKYWLDTEFIEDGKTIDLISLAIFAEDGREYYAISSEFNPTKANDWVVENVLSQLPPAPVGVFRGMPGSLKIAMSEGNFWSPEIINLSDPSISPELKQKALLWLDRKEIVANVIAFCDPVLYGEPEFWAYYADYDWVAFCQLFGRMIDLPKGFPMYCRDIKQECDRLGNPHLPEQQVEHNALDDARWNKLAWEFLSGLNLHEN